MRLLSSLWRSAVMMRWVVCLIASGAVMGVTEHQAVAQPRQKTVLTLYGVRRESPAGASVDPFIERTLGDGLQGHLDYYTEFLDLPRFSELGHEEAFRRFLQAKFAGQTFDLVMPIGNVALAFVTRHRDDPIFSGVPIVFAAFTPPAAPLPNATGVLARWDMKPALDSALALQPDTERVVVVGGAGTFDRIYEDTARAQFKPLEGRVAFQYLTGLAMRDLLPKVAALPPRTIVFYTALSEDGDGGRFMPFDQLEPLSAAANVPVYTWHVNGMGRGSVGGTMASNDIVGIRTAEVALRVLRGERADTIPVADVNWSVTQFDWRQLRRWGISEARLPPGSTVLFKQPSGWEQYRRYILGGILILLVQAALIAALLLQRSRRRKIERALSESEERFRLMADTAPVLVWRAGPDKRCDFFNRPWLEFTGRTMEQESGDGWMEGVHPDDLDRCMGVYNSSFDARRSFRMEFRLRRADGVYRWVLDTGVPRWGQQGVFLGYIGSCIDISERRTAEDALHESQQRYALASAAGSVGVWDWNIETNALYVDPALKAILGFEDAELSSRLEDWEARIVPEDLAAMSSYAQLCINGDTDGFEAEHRMLHKDGSVRWLLARGSLMRRADGTPWRLVGTDVDITERKRSAELFGHAIESSPAGMLMTDSNGTIVMVNSQIEKIFGYRREELIGQRVEMLVPERFRDRHPMNRTEFQYHPAARLGGAGRELFGVRKDGLEVPLEIGLNPISTPDGMFVLGSVTDITERRGVEREKEELMDQLQRVTGRLIAAQESERARIARDLHDDVSQQIAGLSIALSGLKRRIGTQPEDQHLATHVASIQERAATVAENIRHLSHDLHPNVLEHAGLVAALASHCAEMQRQQPVTLTFRTDGDFDGIEPAIALCLYRVAQEALRNVALHAGAREAAVRLLRIENVAELTIADDGKGFDISQARTRSDGLGLVSINERVRLAGGTVSIVTEKQKGTWIRVRVPVVGRSSTSAAYPLPPADWLRKPLTRT